MISTTCLVYIYVQLVTWSFCMSLSGTGHTSHSNITLFILSLSGTEHTGHSNISVRPIVSGWISRRAAESGFAWKYSELKIIILCETKLFVKQAACRTALQLRVCKYSIMIINYFYICALKVYTCHKYIYYITISNRELQVLLVLSALPCTRVASNL